jgi:hypothetical protein
MNKTWPLTFLFLGFFLQAVLKTQELCSLTPFYKADAVVKLHYFSEAQKGLSPEDKDLLKLWESLLTGRAGPVSKWMKERYKLLGLNHIFTPSGFHLSAVLWPIKIFLKTQRMQLGLYLLIGLSFFFLPGMSALKRMLTIKSSQNIFGFRTGFILAIIFDLVWGTFQDSPLGMTYSLMFLGLIYSGRTGLVLAFWIFIAQMMIAYFQGSFISPFLIILNPLLSLIFGLIMPVLLLLSWPLCHWQISLGVSILKGIQFLIDRSAILVQFFPQWEIHCGLFIILIFFSLRKWRWLGVSLLLMAGNLNLDLQNSPSMGRNEFYPQGKFITSFVSKKGLKVYFEDGKCEAVLSRGQWFERCSPKKGSTQKLMKLSCL